LKKKEDVAVGRAHTSATKSQGGGGGGLEGAFSK